MSLPTRGSRFTAACVMIPPSTISLLRFLPIAEASKFPPRLFMHDHHVVLGDGSAHPDRTRSCDCGIRRLVARGREVLASDTPPQERTSRSDAVVPSRGDRAFALRFSIAVENHNLALREPGQTSL